MRNRLLVALLAALTVAARMTRRQVDWFVTDVLGAPSSVGSVQTHLEEASRALEPAWEQARVAVELDPWTGLDETGWRLGQLPHWIWVAHSERAAVYHIDERRTKEVAQKVVGNPDGRSFMTDRYGAYSFLAGERRQICHAHLLRQFVAMSPRDGPIGRIGAQLEQLEREFQKEWAKVKAGERKRDEVVAWIATSIRPRWEALLKEARDADYGEPALVRWLLKEEHRESPWVFLTHPGIEPTNNGSERALRGPPVHRNLSWGSQSGEGLRLMERLWTVTETCRRQGLSVLDYITEAIDAARRGHPAPVLIASSPVQRRSSVVSSIPTSDATL